MKKENSYSFNCDCQKSKRFKISLKAFFTENWIYVSNCSVKFCIDGCLKILEKTFMLSAKYLENNLTDSSLLLLVCDFEKSKDFCYLT